MSRRRSHHRRAALREGRLSDEGSAVVGFVPIELPLAPSVVAPGWRPLGRDSSAAVSAFEIGLAGGRRLKVAIALPTAGLRR